MSVDEYPLRAKDGLTITVVESYIKLYQLMLASRTPEIVTLMADLATIPEEDREALQVALSDRVEMLRTMLRQQVGTLATMRRQSG